MKNMLAAAQAAKMEIAQLTTEQNNAALRIQLLRKMHRLEHNNLSNRR